MATLLKTQITIYAPAATIWDILMDFEQYANWNPFIQTIEGKATVGQRLLVRMPGMTFRPQVLVVEPQAKFKWLGHLLIKGLFDGAHQFELISQADSATLLIHSEEFTGVLVPLLRKMLFSSTLANFEAMNQALKQRYNNPNPIKRHIKT